MLEVSCRIRALWQKILRTTKHHAKEAEKCETPTLAPAASSPLKLITTHQFDGWAHSILDAHDQYSNGAGITQDVRGFDLPYPRNEQFRGREVELSMLEAQLRPGAEPKGLQQVAIVAPARHGKTQLALEFAYRHLNTGDYRKVHWIDCTTRDSARLSFSLPMKEMGHTDTLSDRALLMWKSNLKSDVCPEFKGSILRNWLLIFDNVHYVPILRELWPLKGSWGSVIVITEDERIGNAFSPMRDPFSYLFENTNPIEMPRLEALWNARVEKYMTEDKNDDENELPQ